MPHRRSTRKKFTAETRCLHAVFDVVLREWFCDVRAAATTAAVLTWTVCQVLASLAVLTVSSAWSLIHPADRRALTAGTRAAVRTTIALVHSAPGWIASAAAALAALWCWCDRQAAALVRRCHDAVLHGLDQSRRREASAWREMQQPWRPLALDPVPVSVPEPEPTADPWEEWQDYGSPVGRAA